MKKLSLFLFMGVFFIIMSCNKSTKTEDLQESLDQSQTTEATVIRSDVTVSIEPGATTAELQLPNGQIIQMDIPIEFQLNEDGTPREEKPASSRAGDCNNVIIVHPVPNDPATAGNESGKSPMLAYYSGAGVTADFNQSSSSGNIFLTTGTPVGYKFTPKNFSITNSITLIIGSWSCSGGQFHFESLSFQGTFNNTALGTLTICNGKCGYN